MLLWSNENSSMIPSKKVFFSFLCQEGHEHFATNQDNGTVYTIPPKEEFYFKTVSSTV